LKFGHAALWTRLRLWTRFALDSRKRKILSFLKIGAEQDSLFFLKPAGRVHSAACPKPERRV